MTADQWYAMGVSAYREKKYDEAFKYFQNAAPSHAGAMYDLAFCYHHALGTTCDLTEAFKWYSKAAEQGNSAALYQMGVLHEFGFMGQNEEVLVKVNLKKAREFYQKAIDSENIEADENVEAGVYGKTEDALFILDCVYQDQGDKEHWYQKGLEAYDEGEDYDAARWWRRAAEKGHPEAQYRLAKCYSANPNFDRVYTEAIKWMSKSAKSGYAQAQADLGSWYRIGWGVKKDEAEAFKWLMEAAKQDIAEAQYYLAEFYEEGKGVRKDIAKAIEWYHKAASNGDPDATDKLEELEETYDETSLESPPLDKIERPSYKKLILLFLFGAAVVLIRLMDILSYQAITDEEAHEMAREVTITVPNQKVTLFDTGETVTLKKKSTVKLLGICKRKLNKGDSPLLTENPIYLLELPDSTWAYGRITETAIGKTTLLPDGDTTVMKQVVYQFGRFNKDDFPNDFLYNIRPATKKNGFFLFPKRQGWNEFRWSQKTRSILLVLAYLVEIILIISLFKILSNLYTNRQIKRGKPIIPGRLKVYKILIVLLFAAVVVLIRRMDQMTYRPITEDEVMEMAQEVKVSTPDQEITLLDTTATQTLKVKSTVKVLGVYKESLSKGDSPLKTNNYLVELPDGIRGYGPLAEASVVQQKTIPDDDTIKQCVTYLGGEKNGFFLYPKYQEWNEFRLSRWFRIVLLILAYLTEAILLFVVWLDLKEWKNHLMAKLGNGKALHWVGYCYEYSNGVSFNRDEALKWYKKSAEKGYSRAFLTLGNIYEGLRPYERFEIDYNEAKYYYQKGANAKNNRIRKKCKDGAARMEKYLDVNNDFGNYYDQACHGDSFAQVFLGMYYNEGYNKDGISIPKNLKESVRWYKKAAAQGHVIAYTNLGYCYIEGEGVEKDVERGVELLKKAVQGGYGYAALLLAVYYQDINEDETVHWLRKGAEMGDQDCIGFLKKKGYKV